VKLLIQTGKIMNTLMQATPSAVLTRSDPRKSTPSGQWIRTFAVITTDANELVADIHDRMPLILAPGTRAG
jgi:putative SOS response-associated peptidase YedK